MYRLLILALLLTPLAGHAQVYRTTDEQGNVIFSDAPPAGSGQAERIEIPETNTTPPPPSWPEPPAEPEPEPEEEGPVSYEVAIIIPLNETSFPMGPGNFSVEAKVKPALGKSESLLLMMDGVPWGKPQRDNTWELTNVFRGAHDLTVAVVDAEGELLVNSSPVRVFVHRPSINFRNRN